MTLHQIKVTLTGVRPSIWRRLLLSPEITLGKLHRIVQTAMGWDNCHLHRFLQDGREYSDPSFELERVILDERKVTLGVVLPQPGSRLVYEYDFGDAWQHEILCEEIAESDGQTGPAICVDGARKCPSEDSGGPGAYSDLLHILKNPKHRDYDEMRNWVGSRFNPDAFDPDKINARLFRELRRKK